MPTFSYDCKIVSDERGTFLVFDTEVEAEEASQAMLGRINLECFNGYNNAVAFPLKPELVTYFYAWAGGGCIGSGLYEASAQTPVSVARDTVAARARKDSGRHVVVTAFNRV